MKWYGIVLILALMALSVCADSIPTLYATQGRITNSTTNATIQGSFTAVFNIYTVLSGGSAIRTNTTTITTDINGIYNANLNITNLSFNQPYYLGTTIGADPEWSPRLLMASVPFANRANISDHLNPNLTISWTNITAFPSSTPTCPNGQFTQNLSLSSGGVLTSVCAAPAASSGTLNTVQSIDNYITVANSTTSNFSANLTTFDARYRQLTGLLNWTNLTAFPNACSAGNAVTGVGASLSCAAFLQSYSETDPLWTGNQSRVTGLETSNITTNGNLSNNWTYAQNTNGNLSGNWTYAQNTAGNLSGNWTAIQNLQGNATANWSIIQGLNTTKAGIGNTATCTYGIANFTSVVAGAPVLTCAAAQGGSEPLWAGNSTLVAYLASKNNFTANQNNTANWTGAYFIGSLNWSNVTGAPAFLTSESDPLWTGNSTLVAYLTGANFTGNINSTGSLNASQVNATTIYQNGNQVAGTGSTSSCAYGIKNETSVSTGASSVTCATQQGTVTSIGTTGPITGGTITGAGTIAINVLNTTQAGYVNNVSTGLNVSKDGNISLGNTAVAPSTYGGASTVGQFIVDAQGRLTSATNVTISIPYANVTGTPTTFANWSNSSLINTTTTNATVQIFNPFGLQTCNSSSRGSLQPLLGAGGKSDTLWWCAKNNSDSYGWILFANSSASGSG